MAQWVKGLATKPENLSSNLRSHKVEEENRLLILGFPSTNGDPQILPVINSWKLKTNGCVCGTVMLYFVSRKIPC